MKPRIVVGSRRGYFLGNRLSVYSARLPLIIKDVQTLRSMTDTQTPSAPSVPNHKPSITLFLWRWFWRVALIVSPFTLWYCYYAPANSIAWAASFPAAQEQSVQSGKPMILFFTGPWCVPCRIMKRNVWADDDVAASVNTAFIPVTIDVDDPGSAALLTRYSVTATPNTIITDSQGNVLQQKMVGLSKADFLELLQGAAKPK